MAKELIFLTHGDGQGEAIVKTFGERSGLAPQEIAGGFRFELGEDDHGVKVVETLTDIDPQWSRHITLGEPGSTDS
jgi:hypothetical protein